MIGRCGAERRKRPLMLGRRSIRHSAPLHGKSALLEAVGVQRPFLVMWFGTDVRHNPGGAKRTRFGSQCILVAADRRYSLRANNPTDIRASDNRLGEGSRWVGHRLGKSVPTTIVQMSDLDDPDGRQLPNASGARK